MVGLGKLIMKAICLLCISTVVTKIFNGSSWSGPSYEVEALHILRPRTQYIIYVSPGNVFFKVFAPLALLLTTYSVKILILLLMLSSQRGLFVISQYTIR